MSYSVRLYRPARSYLERCDRVTRRRLAARIDQLADEPFRYGKPLQGAGAYRSSRVGGLRILYEVDEAARVVHVYTIGPRGDIYGTVR